MNDSVLIGIAVLCYGLAAVLQTREVVGKVKYCKSGLITLGLIASIAQGALLHTAIDLPFGQNIALTNMLATVVWFATVLMLCLAWFKPMESLALLLFPLNVMLMVISRLFPSEKIIAIYSHPHQLFHVFLAISSFSILLLGLLQSLVLVTQHALLRHRRMTVAMQTLPAVETMEALLFQILSAGFISLSLVLLTAYISFENIFIPPIRNKTLITLFAWSVFFVLLLGRFRFGWRGFRAVSWTVLGFISLIMAYLGGRLLIIT